MALELIMSEERDLLKRFMTEVLKTEEDVVSLFNDIKECLAQPEQDLEVLKTDWVNFGYTTGREEGYNRGYAIAREDYKQKVINAFGVDDEY